MNHTIKRTVALALLVLSISTLMLFSSSKAVSARVTPQHAALVDASSLVVPGQLIVKLVENEQSALSRLESASLARLNQQYGVTAIAPLMPDTAAIRESVHGIGRIFILTMPSHVDVWSMAAAYAADADIDYAEPNVIFSAPNSAESRSRMPGNILSAAMVAPNDDRFPEQWALHNTGQSGGTPDADIDWLEAWEYIQLNPPVFDPIVAIVDSGINLANPEISGQVLPGGYDFYDDDNDPHDEQGHGTGVAGILAATTNDGFGLAGVCPNCDLLAVRANFWVIDVGVLSVGESIIYAADPELGNADVLQMAIGGLCTQLAADAVNFAYDQDAVMVGASGTTSGPYVWWPARFERVIAVSGSDHNDQFAGTESGQGPQIDVAAPGIEVLANWGAGDQTPDNGYWFSSGTSLATPHVSGVAGLIIGQNPSLTNAEIRQILRDTAEDRGEPGFDDEFGHGRINAYDAIQMAQSPPVVRYEPPVAVCNSETPFFDVLGGHAAYTLERALELFTATACGSSLGTLNAAHSLEIAAILAANPELDAELYALYLLALPYAEQLIYGSGDDELSPEFLNQLEQFMLNLASAASTSLAGEIMTVLTDLNQCLVPTNEMLPRLYFPLVTVE